MSVACTLIFSAYAAAEDSHHYVIATGTPGAKPYVVGVALQSLVNLRLMPDASIGLNTITSDSYTENLQALREGRIQFGIADSVATDIAARGTGSFEPAGPNGDLRGIAVLWQEVDQFLVDTDRALSGTVTDLVALSGDKIATDSSNRDATNALLTAFGKEVSDTQALPIVEGAGQLDALSQGIVNAMVVSGPLQSIGDTEIVDALDGRAQLLEITGRQFARLGQGWRRYPIPSGTYASLDYDIDTISRAVMLVADSSVDEQAVYKITRTMFENLPFLASIDQTATLISLDSSLDGMNVPVHPGAARYYQEVGLLPSGSTDPVDFLSVPAPSVVGQVAAKSLEKAKRAEENATTLVAAATSDETVAVPVAAAANRSVAALPVPTAEELPSLTLDDEMLNRSRAEIHDGAEVLKIDRPVDLDRPGTEVINVYFGLGDTQPNAEGAADTKEVGQRILQMYQARKSIPEVYVEGHADRTGDWKLNYEIAHRRAAATKTILIDAGVPDSWIQISDYSEQNLAVPTEDGVGNWRNRRVEVTVIPTGDDEAQQSEASVN